MFRFFRSLWKTTDLRQKVLFTIGIILLYRVLIYIPLPGVNAAQLRSLFEGNQLLSLLNLFSGGGLVSFSIITLGLNPYINASIIMQLLTMVFPKLEELSKEGEAGQRKMNQYTRILTVPLSIILGISIFYTLRANGVFLTSDYVQIALLLLTMTAGTMLLVWLGELITERGIGNGISLIIFAGILANFPVIVGQAFQTQTVNNGLTVVILAAIALAVIAGIVYITEGQRRIPVQYAKRLAGNRLLGSQATHIPLRVNQTGVVPIIFAISLVLLPGTVATYLTRVPVEWLAAGARAVETFFANTFYFAVIYFILVVAFSFFYSTVTFNPDRVAEQLQKNGGFVPGMRPGKPTSDYLRSILVRVTLMGGLFLGVIAVLPYASNSLFPDISALAIGGTSLLIVVSVVLETSKQAEAMLVMRNYDSYAKS